MTGLEDSRFLLLTTTRRSGAKVATPFGALHRDGRIYCYTAARSGKVKRIRQTSRVELAPCTQGGTVTGPSIWGEARVLRGAEARAIEAAFDALWTRQYGLLWWIQKRIGDLRGRKRVVIEIVPILI